MLLKKLIKFIYYRICFFKQISVNEINILIIESYYVEICKVKIYRNEFG